MQILPRLSWPCLHGSALNHALVVILAVRPLERPEQRVVWRIPSSVAQVDAPDVANALAITVQAHRLLVVSEEESLVAWRSRHIGALHLTAIEESSGLLIMGQHHAIAGESARGQVIPHHDADAHALVGLLLEEVSELQLLVSNGAVEAMVHPNTPTCDVDELPCCVNLLEEVMPVLTRSKGSISCLDRWYATRGADRTLDGVAEVAIHSLEIGLCNVQGQGLRVSWCELVPDRQGALRVKLQGCLFRLTIRLQEIVHIQPCNTQSVVLQRVRIVESELDGRDVITHLGNLKLLVPLRGLAVENDLCLAQGSMIGHRLDVAICLGEPIGLLDAFRAHDLQFQVAMH
mmetsp:Transcript_28369/g.65766  ORF Transcript_28369/g.65766 Transcript_28369/m.65766 type:complete len:346 (+) Transcript_28369:243-1280(+)